MISWYHICMKENLIHYRTCVCNINYHMVWSVKYRRKILNAEVEAYLQEAFRTFSGNKKPALERGAVESFLLCGNGRICIGRKYPQVHRTSEQSVLIRWRRGNASVKENIHKGQPGICEPHRAYVLCSIQALECL